jgi:hypothetical protein
MLSAIQGQTINSRGLFYIRNQFPVNLQFLSFYAQEAPTQEKGSLSIALQYTHSNTFAMFEGSLLQIPEGTDRAQYINELYAAANNYYFDTASGTLNLNSNYGISDKISVGVNIPLISYQSGFMDMPIETFHNTFGIANVNRARTLKNQSEIFIKSGEEVYSSGNGIGMGDIVFDIKTNLFGTYSDNFSITLLSALKLPTGDYKKLNGSGSIDYGFNLLITNIWKRHTITNNISAVFPGTWKLFNMNPRNIYGWVIGYEYYFNQNWSFIFQNRILSSPLHKDDFPSAAKTAFEWTSGVKIDVLHNLRLSLAITQNYINHENVPDFGFHVGIRTFFGN